MHGGARAHPIPLKARRRHSMYLQSTYLRQFRQSPEFVLFQQYATTLQYLWSTFYFKSYLHRRLQFGNGFGGLFILLLIRLLDIKYDCNLRNAQFTCFDISAIIKCIILIIYLHVFVFSHK